MKLILNCSKLEIQLFKTFINGATLNMNSSVTNKALNADDLASKYGYLLGTRYLRVVNITDIVVGCLRGTN